MSRTTADFTILKCDRSLSTGFNRIDCTTLSTAQEFAQQSYQNQNQVFINMPYINIITCERVTSYKRPTWRIAMASVFIATIIAMVVWIIVMEKDLTYNMEVDPFGTIIMTSLVMQVLIGIVCMTWTECRHRISRDQAVLPRVEIRREGVLLRAIY
ncbi:hypothetical protein B0J11DRAFT_529670 [Dendryphion nanum]|uniref:Uncharacterized protein n=1 Tax=Dendryphion nanum TaxID=256645 RepID=A0A9P9DRH4_9PLEO|nr:hypothetical protein B0J11DRAFT_529670 [Dendryphion nanum]